MNPMKNADEKNRRQTETARALALLELAGAPTAAEPVFRLLRSPFFLRALLYFFCYGLTAGVFQYLYKTGVFSVQAKDCYVFAMFLFLLVGGLRLLGKLTPARATTIVLFAGILQLSLYLYSQTRWGYIAYFLLAAVMLAVWLWTAPDVAADFGLRRRRLFADIGVTVLLTTVFSAYFAFLLHNMGFAMKFRAWVIVPHALGQLPENFITFGFIYAVWNRLQEKGITQAGSIGMFALTIIMMQTPVIVAFRAAGTVNTIQMFSAIISSALIFVLIMSLTFRNLRTALPAVFLLTAMQEIIKMAGVV
jgi:hypothetical protein